jgi:hypothetical protein
LEKLIKTAAESIKEHTANEHGKTIGQINDHIDEEHQNTRKEVVKQISKNMATEHEETRDLISEHLGRLRIEDNEEHAKTRGRVDQHIQNLQAATLSTATRDKFLKSLNFQGRDQRFNDVKEAHYKTFQWLFDDKDQADSQNCYLQEVESEHSEELTSYHSDDSNGLQDKNKQSDNIISYHSDDDKGLQDESDQSNNANSYNSEDSNGLLDESQELDLVYEDLVEDCRSKVISSFADWLKSKKAVYWIKAKAGAGKSTLMKFLYNDPRTSQLLGSTTSGKTLILIHFFYLMGSQMQCNIKGLLCTLLYQLILQDEDGTWTAELFWQNPLLKYKELDSN